MQEDIATFFDGAKQWKKELLLLREIALSTGLEEAYKWKHPCYTSKGKNIVIIHGFKEYVAILFFKGALLADKKGILIQQTDNTQAARQIRFVNLAAIKKQENTIVQYIMEAIDKESAGLKLPTIPTAKLSLPPSLVAAFKKSTSLKKAFEKLTPGRQKAYILYFSEAKQIATQVNRIEKYTQRILNGKGLNDCVCGMSKRMPNCDGSHKYL